MDINLHRINRSSFRCKVYIVLCILLNVSLAYLAHSFNMPVYLDTIGTILMSALGGFLPGLIVAVATNVLCSFFNHYALYYTLISVMSALLTVWFVRAGAFKKKLNVVFYMLALLLLSGVFGGCVQWLTINGPQFETASRLSHRLNFLTGIGYFPATLVVNVGVNALDKITTSLVALFIVSVIPEKERKAIWESNWKQTPMDREQIHSFSGIGKKGSIQRRMGVLLSLAALSLVLVMVWVGIGIFYRNAKDEYTHNAQNAAKFTAAVVNGNAVEKYMELGEQMPGYHQTREMMFTIRKSISGIKYLYVVQIQEDGYHYVFDLETDDDKGYNPGDVVPFEDAILPSLPDLLAGKAIVPIETDDVYGWLLTAYYPVKNSYGTTVAYAAADVSMELLSDSTKEFLIKSFLIFSGFFVLILGYGIWTSGFYLVYPISSMTRCVKEFVENDQDQKYLDENVQKIRNIDVTTGDDVEDLYKAICEMEANFAEQMRSIRHYSDATSKMQNGLIITMADLVENRDNDTGAHIQKTAAYVRIIAEGLLKKGYYAEKITPQFISDVVTSAPLHDIGKINISDTILNKPGKLTAEEFEIMKTHSTAGMKIMEKAINTTSGESYLKEARNMAAYHHERWDGKGYPEGLHGQVIPLSARIMAVADVFDALVSDRVYKPAYSFEKSVEIIKEGSGTQFDPKCVEVFLDSLTEVRIVLRSYQDR